VGSRQEFLSEVKEDTVTIAKISGYLESLPSEQQVSFMDCAKGLFRAPTTYEFGLLLTHVTDPVWRKNVQQEIARMEDSIL
jgi:hypothetical protein